MSFDMNLRALYIDFEKCIFINAIDVSIFKQISISAYDNKPNIHTSFNKEICDFGMEITQTRKMH